MGLLESTCVGNPRTFYTQKTQKMTRIWPSEAYSGGGYWGYAHPPGPVKSIDFRGFSCPNGC